MSDRKLCHGCDGYECQLTCAYPSPITTIRAQAAQIEAQQEKIQDLLDQLGQECGCAYDRPSDVCIGHKRKMDAQATEIERLKQEANLLRTMIDEMARPARKAPESKSDEAK